MDELYLIDGLYYKKFTDVPFTGKTNGQIQGSFKNGILHGSYVEYYSDGKIKEKGTYNEGKRTGPYLGYHNNGNLRFNGNWLNDKEEGAFESFYENGQLFLKGNWKNGKKIGYWEGFYEDGKKYEILSGNYINGVNQDYDEDYHF